MSMDKLYKKYLSERLFKINHRLFKNCRSWRFWGDIKPDQCKLKKEKVASYFQRKTLYIWLANTNRKKSPATMLYSGKIQYLNRTQGWAAHVH